MNKSQLSTNSQASSQLNDDDEIDLRQVAAALGRQKILIGSITFASALLRLKVEALQEASLNWQQPTQFSPI